MHTPNHCFQKKNSLPVASGSVISSPIIAQSTNSFALENNRQWCPDHSGSNCTRNSPVQCWPMANRQLS